jgi:hypothetical protein
MSGVQISTWAGSQAHVAKRALGRLSDGRAVAVVVNTNVASQSAAGDQTGVAKVEVWVSTDVTQTAFTRLINYTPGNTIATQAQYARYSIVVGTDNALYLAYAGIGDWSLRHVKWSWTGSTWGAATEQTVVAASYSDRFRVIDMDVADTSSPMIAAYETDAAAANGVFLRVYIRLSDGTTWRRAVNHTAFTTGGVRINGDDITVSYRGDGVVSNVVRFLLAGTQTSGTVDNGDLVREYSFNVSSGATDSATTIGTWFTNRYKDVNAGYRKSLIFKLSSTIWLLAGLNGSSVPTFHVTKLTTGDHAPPQVRTIGYSSTAALAKYFTLNWSAGQQAFRAIWTASYADNVLVMAFHSTGQINPRIVREVVFTWPDLATVGADPVKDIIPRPTDENYWTPDGPIGIYGGGNNRNQVGDLSYDFAIIYGRGGGVIDTTLTGVSRVRFVSQDTYDAPIIISPDGTTEPTNTPNFKIRVEQTNVFPNLMGKASVMLASDPAYTTNVRTIVQPNSAFQYFGSPDGITGASKIVDISPADLSGALFSGTWYWRSRISSDKGRNGAWSETKSFVISHPPTATPVLPKPNQTLQYEANTTFAWTFTDTNPGDAQSQYRLIIKRAFDALEIYNSGWVVSSAKSVQVPINVIYKDVLLYWTVELKDADGVAGAASAQTQFTVADPPTVSITSPTPSEVLATGSPTISWTFSAGGSRTQASYRVYIRTYPAMLRVAESGWRPGNNASHSFLGNVLANNAAYRVYVEVMDNVGMTDSDLVEFTTDWIEPALGDITVTYDNFKTQISWTDANQDADFVEWRVYRRYMKVATSDLDLDSTASNWVLVGSTTEVAANYSFSDYLVPLNTPVDYVVVQVAERFGSLLESNITSWETVNVGGDRYYFVPKDFSIGTIASFEAAGVTSDGFQMEIERETLHVKGRGRQVQVGDNLGYSGTLGIHLRNPDTVRQDRQFFEYVAQLGTQLYIKSPFGDVVLCSIDTPQVSRIGGVGPTDMVDMTIQYVQIYDDEEIIRSA